MNIDPTMPTLTLGLSEWRYAPHGPLRYRVWTVGGEIVGVAAHAFPEQVRALTPFSPMPEWVGCNGIEDGMRIADEMLRKWIEEAGNE